MKGKSCIYQIVEQYIDNQEDMDEYILTIRRRLTKKEYKILLFGCEENIDVTDIIDRLNLDERRYKDLYKSALKKIEILIESNTLK